MTPPASRFGLFDALERVAEMSPRSVAVRCGGDSWTFSELRERVVRLGNTWRAEGLGPGDRVAVLADNCHRFVEVYWACVYLGAVVVPLERRLVDDEVVAILGEIQPTLVITDDPEKLELLGRPESVRMSAVFDGPAHGATALDEWIGEGAAAIQPAPGDPDRAVAVFYTAAMQGHPQGAVVTQRNLLTQAAQTAAALGLVEEDSQGLFLPLAHTFGGYLMFVGTCRGVAITVLTQFDPVAAAKLIDAGDVTFFAGFAPMPARIADAADAAALTISGRLRLVVGLDAAATIRRYLDLGVRWMNFYGQTETSGLVAAGEVHPDAIESSYVGRPLMLSRLSVRDQAGKPLPAGEAGEVWVRSDAVVQRYWPDRPTMLSADGWLRTGDILAAGVGQEFRFIGRTTDKDLIKPGGLNVYPAEVEEVLTAYPGIARAFVFGLPDDEWGERVCAVVIAADSAAPPRARALAEHCRTRIAGFKCPRTIYVATDVMDAESMTRQSASRRFRAQV